MAREGGVKYSKYMVTAFMDGILCNINKSRREEEQKLVLQAAKHKHFFSSFMDKTLLL